MSVIAICAPPMGGIINCTFRIARMLKAAGHTIVYIGIPDCQAFVAPSGFPFRPVFQRWFPSGYLSSVAEGGKQTRIIKDFAEALIRGEESGFEEVCRELRPDFVLISATVFQSIVYALLTYKLGIQSAYLSASFEDSDDWTIPPVNTPLLPGKGLLGHLKTRIAWIRLYGIAAIYTLIGLALRKTLYWPALVRRLAATCGCDLKNLRQNHFFCAPKLNIPWIVACPPELDFPRQRHPGRYYLGATVDFERPEPDFPWHRLDDDKPLVLCALGSMAVITRARYRRFYQSLVDAARSRPEQQWVIALGENCLPDDLCSVPPNVLLSKKVPQLALLRRASLMIHHGGTGSMQECAYFGVPMIVTYFSLFDGPGNAARVTSLGIGLMRDLRNITAQRIGEMVDHILRDQTWRIEARLLSDEIRREDSFGRLERVFDAILRARPVARSNESDHSGDKAPVAVAGNTGT